MRFSEGVDSVCGIGGVWSARELKDASRVGRLFADALAHRGPDGEGFLPIPADPSCAPRPCGREGLDNAVRLTGLLIHRRLSIIDLATGDQPMGTADGQTWIVFNGEIYNYPELKREIEASEDAPFRTSSDTEVILRVYRRWGLLGFGRLNGIFAFALYDAPRREMILARDPVGVKPVYWTRGARGVAFSSEIRPLLSAGFAERTLGPERLAQYLFYRFVPAPATVWQSVDKVVPGHALRFDVTGRMLEDRDFAAPAPAPAQWSRRNVSDDLAPRFEAAVHRQMLSDVPVGAFLSGGLDSSLVVAALGDRALGLPTFAVGFPDHRGQDSELTIARRSAAALGTDHAGQELEAQGYFDRLPWAIAETEEPLAHPGMLLQADLSALARRRVKVVLTGQGADEPLGGYPRHHGARVLPLLAGLLGRAARSEWVERWGARREFVARVRRVLMAPAGVERAAALFSPLSLGEAGTLARGCGTEAGREAILGAIRPWWDRGAGLDDIARTLYVDVRTSLADDLLLVADKMSMAHSLEARVPYLDLEYLTLLESIRGPERVAFWGSRKRIQHGVARRLLPAELYRTLASSSRPWRKKRGFDVPVTEWFRGPLRERLAPLLTGPDSLLPSYVDRDRVRESVRAYLGGSGRAYRQILALFVLEAWLQNNVGQSGHARPRTKS